MNYLPNPNNEPGRAVVPYNPTGTPAIIENITKGTEGTNNQSSEKKTRDAPKFSDTRDTLGQIMVLAQAQKNEQGQNRGLEDELFGEQVEEPQKPVTSRFLRTLFGFMYKPENASELDQSNAKKDSEVNAYNLANKRKLRRVVYATIGVGTAVAITAFGAPALYNYGKQLVLGTNYEAVSVNKK